MENLAHNGGTLTKWRQGEVTGWQNLSANGNAPDVSTLKRVVDTHTDKGCLQTDRERVVLQHPLGGAHSTGPTLRRGQCRGKSTQRKRIGKPGHH